MPRHLLPAFSFLLLLLGCTCGPTYAGYFPWDNNFPLLKPWETKVPAKMGDEESTKEVLHFYSPFFAAGDGLMVVVSEARYTHSDKERIDIVARCFATEGEEWEVYTVEGKGEYWALQLALQRKEEKTEKEKLEQKKRKEEKARRKKEREEREERGVFDYGDDDDDYVEEEEDGVNHYGLRRPRAVVRGNKVYLLAFYKRFDGDEYHLDLAVGDIMSHKEYYKTIGWSRSEPLRSNLAEEIKKKGLTVFPGSNNSALLTSKGTIVFGADATKKKGVADDKPGFAIMQLKDDGQQWEVSFVEKPKECHVFSLLEWKEKLIGVLSGCSTGTKYVKEYDEVSKEWKDANDTFLRMWSSEHALSDLISVTIENKSVLLFIEEHSAEKYASSKYKISLRFTDGIRMGDAVWIDTRYYWPGFGKLLYTNDELFFMYEGSSSWLQPIVFQHLPGQLETIKSIVKTWAEKDAYFSKPCSETAPRDASAETFCVTPMPTDGLVSFWSDNSTSGSFVNSHTWHDEYRCVEVGVSDAYKVTNGFRFHGGFAMPRSLEGVLIEANQYDFKRYGLTVMMTVVIHENAKNDRPLLTVEGFDFFDGDRFGLWYKDAEWKMVSTDGQEGAAIDLETQKEYKVAFTLHNSTISVYVNGKSQGNPLPISVPEKFFEYIFIGGYGDVRGGGIIMTVTNVLLYNRALSDTELEVSSKRVPPAKIAGLGKADGSSTDSSGSIGSKNSSQFGSKTTPTTPEDGFVYVRMSFTLLSLLGCFSFAIFW